MGACMSTPTKSRCQRHHIKNFHSKKRRKVSRGSAHFVIPVTGSSIGATAQKHQFQGKNSKEEIAHCGTCNAFTIETPTQPQLTIDGNGNDHSHLEQDENGVQNPTFGSPSSRGSKHEVFFDTENNFNTDSDDEFMSSFGDFPASSSNTSISYPPSKIASQRPSLTTLKVQMSKVDDWMAGTSQEVGSLHRPPPEDEHKSTSSFGIRNGIAALAGSKDNLRSEDNPLYEASPRKSFPTIATEDKVTPSRPRWERAVSELLGRKTVMDAASPSPNSAQNVSVLTAEVAKYGDHKGVFDGLCLPRLRTVVSSSGSRPVSPMSAKKKSSMLRLSFKRCTSAEVPDNHDDSLSSKYYVQRPLGGSQVSHCSKDKPVDGCWSEVSSTNFKLRGKHYGKDKRKFYAPNFSVFVPIGVDLLMSEQKIDHVAQYVELPIQELISEFMDSLPPIFIVNIQLPLYPPAIFLGDTDGEGLSLVLYFKLSDDLAKMAPPYFKEILRKFVNDETEKVKGFVGESVLSFRDRLKVVARCVNPDEVQLSSTEKTLLVNYNEKPVLSRPQHSFYKGANYLEVDLDVHRFSYIARKGFDTFRDRLKSCVLDIGLTIQGTRPEELPEQILAAVRLHKLDFGDYRVLQVASGASSVRSEELKDIAGSP
ncbi:unnamed protein product [Calypogeia fissa]